jgi:putative flippase GtrA
MPAALAGAAWVLSPFNGQNPERINLPQRLQCDDGHISAAIAVIWLPPIRRDRRYPISSTVDSKTGAHSGAPIIWQYEREPDGTHDPRVAQGCTDRLSKSSCRQRNNMKTHLREFTSFALIGLLNTGVHLVILVGLVENHILISSLANVVAFLSANLFSYGLNSRFTFRRRLNWSKYINFLLCSALGAGLSYLISRGAELAHWNYLVGFLLTVILMPPVNFWFVRRFAFSVSKAPCDGSAT